MKAIWAKQRKFASFDRENFSPNWKMIAGKAALPGLTQRGVP
jgi:hypothetical protein